MNSTDPLEPKPCVGSCQALRPSELAFGDMAAQAHETTMPGAHPEHLILRSLPNTCHVIGVLKHRSPTERGTSPVIVLLAATTGEGRKARDKPEAYEAINKYVVFGVFG